MEQISSWGVESVWGEYNYYNSGTPAQDKYAFVIDSGISLDTKDLNVNTEWAKSFVKDHEDPFNDVVGHGTAVASIIGAKANSHGLTGVAPGAQLVPIKVFGKTGSTSNTIVNAALQYVKDIIIANNLQDKAVVNLSLGSRGGDRHPLITEMHEAGIKMAIAAGNSGMDVDNYSPASYGHLSNVYTVSSITKYGSYSVFTNFDNGDLVDDVDFSAPGSLIEVYNTDGSVRTGSGTSFAAPHVAGLLLMGNIKAGEKSTLTPRQRNRGMEPDPLALHVPVSNPDPDPTPTRPGPRRKFKGDKNDNRIIGTADADHIRGVKGDDELIGLAGDDIIRGAKGDDYLDGGAGSDLIVGGLGFNTFADQRDGSSDVLILKGDGASDTIEGLDLTDLVLIKNVWDTHIQIKQLDNDLGIYVHQELEAIYKGGDLTVADLSEIVLGI